MHSIKCLYYAYNINTTGKDEMFNYLQVNSSHYEHQMNWNNQKNLTLLLVFH